METKTKFEDLNDVHIIRIIIIILTRNMLRKNVNFTITLIYIIFIIFQMSNL